MVYDEYMIAMIGFTILCGIIGFMAFIFITNQGPTDDIPNLNRYIPIKSSPGKLEDFMGGNHNPSLTETKSTRIETVYKGIQKPHGIGFGNSKVYVSSETSKELFSINGDKLESVALVNFAHDMLFEADGSIITPIFIENTVAKISRNGIKTDLVKNLSGPNGIIQDKDGNIYVSNYLSGTVITFNKQSPHDYKTVISSLKGPAGMALDQERNYLYIANYLNNSITRYNAYTSKIYDIRPFGLGHIESLYLTQDSKLVATASNRGQGIVAEINTDGTFKTLLETGLPDPLVGYFVDDTTVYLVSPNDPLGRVLKAKYQ